jgi:hypothetical protein
LLDEAAAAEAVGGKSTDKRENPEHSIGAYVRFENVCMEITERCWEEAEAKPVTPMRESK